MESTPQRDIQLAIVPPQSKQSQSLLESDRMLAEIISMVAQLADLMAKQMTAEQLKAYALTLVGERVEVLRYAFNKAARRCKFFPKPAEILEICSPDCWNTDDDLLVDEAWDWVCNYINEFGSDARTRYEFEDLRAYDIAGLRSQLRGQRLRGLPEGTPYWKTIRDIPDNAAIRTIKPPTIPDHIGYALRQLGGTERGGLERFYSTFQEPEQIGLLRHNFDLAFRRAVVLKRRMAFRDPQKAIALVSGDVGRFYELPGPAISTIRFLPE